MNNEKNGKLAGIAIKRQRRAPLDEVREVAVTVEGGLEGNIAQAERRQVTLLSREQWEAVRQELGVDLPWHARRANLLIEGIDLQSLAGGRLRIGAIEVAVDGETMPCSRMDEVFPGLQERLRPDCRGGVHGRVLAGGTIRVGDTVVLLNGSD